MIAATEELHQEMLEFTSLIEHLNKVLRPRGIELKRVKWNSEEEKGDFQEKLKDCEFCLKLYWTELSSNSEKELRLAYDRLKQGDNPKNLYVFFKEPANDISDALKDFKANFVTNYGHFFCKFDNVDTMNLHFILQFEDLQNRIDSNVISIKEGKVFVGDESIANLDNIPFAALNKEYQRLKKELYNLDEQLTTLKKSFSDNPADNDILSELVKVSTNRNKVSEEFEKHQNYLFNIAISFASKSEQLYSERLARARELFEKGEVSEADRILNLDQIKREAEAERSAFILHQKNLEIKIEEFRTKAKTVMANSEIEFEDRFHNACDAYTQSIENAEIIGKANILTSLKYEFACFLQIHNRINDALALFEELLSNYNKLSKDQYSIYCPNIASTLNHIAQLKTKLEDFENAEQRFKDALKLYKELSTIDPKKYNSRIAYTLSDLARLYLSTGKLYDAKKANDDALFIWKELSEINYERYHPELARTLARSLRYATISEKTLPKYRVAEEECLKDLDYWKKYAKRATYNRRILYVLRHTINLHVNLGKYHEAKEECLMEIRIREKLAKDNPDAQNPDLALAYEKIAEINCRLNYLSEAKLYYKKAIKLWKAMTDISPEAFINQLPLPYENLAKILIKQMQYEEAEIAFKEAITIWKQLCSNTSNSHYFQRYSHSLEDFADFHYAVHKFDEGKSEYLELLNLLSRSENTDNKNIQLKALAMKWWKFGNLNYEKNLYNDAEISFRESLSFHRKLQKEDNNGHHEKAIAPLLQNLANLHQKQGLYVQAEKELSEAILAWKSLVNNGFLIHSYDLAQSVILHADLFCILNEGYEALESYKCAYDLCQKLKEDVKSKQIIKKLEILSKTVSEKINQIETKSL